MILQKNFPDRQDLMQMLKELRTKVAQEHAKQLPTFVKKTFNRAQQLLSVNPLAKGLHSLSGIDFDAARALILDVQTPLEDIARLFEKPVVTECALREFRGVYAAA